MSVISIAYLALVIAAFVVFAISLFAVYIYVNTGAPAQRAASPEPKSEETSAELPRAA